MKKILVYGFYGKNNIGDELFKDVFKNLFPYVEFIFTDHIDDESLKNKDAIFIGGGSFLESAPKITESALNALKDKKIFYIGVGGDSNIHPIHFDLLSGAKLVAIRDFRQFDFIKTINQNTFVIPDLVFYLQSKIKLENQKLKSILILPNSNIIPDNKDPHWKFAAWEYFKSEFSQFLDWLIENEYELNFFPLCQANKMHDNWAINDLISQMSYRNNNMIVTHQHENIEDISKMFSKHSAIITQRFHGIVLSEMTQTPYISIYHHSKLENCYPNNGKFISYYNLSKQNLIDIFNDTLKIKFKSLLPLDSHIFETLNNKINELI